MGSIIKLVPVSSSRKPTSHELGTAVLAMTRAGYSLAEHYREAWMWQMSVHLCDENGSVASRLTVDVHLGNDEVESYYCSGTSDALRLFALEVARLAGPQIMLAADAECVGVHVAELSRVPTTMEAFQ